MESANVRNGFDLTPGRLVDRGLLAAVAADGEENSDDEPAVSFAT